jgi:lysophospholipid acyltransferase (LPLAT)-like uncharacterized protein
MPAMVFDAAGLVKAALAAKLRAAPRCGQNFPMSSKKSSEIRGDRKAEILGTLAGWLIKGLAATLRYEVEDRSGVLTPTAFPPPVIFAMWHNRIIAIPPIWKRSGGRFRKTAVLTSASKDGATLAKAMAVFGLGAIRGSSSRRAVAALIGMKRAIQEGSDVCITPDGPRGPRYSFHAGVIKLAESTGAPIVPIHAICQSAWRLKTWDGLLIPKPFTRVKVIFDVRLEVPPKLDEAAFEAERKRVCAILLTGTLETDLNS